MSHMDISMLYLALFLSVSGVVFGTLLLAAAFVMIGHIRKGLALRMCLGGVLLLVTSGYMIHLAGTAIQIRTAIGGTVSSLGTDVSPAPAEITVGVATALQGRLR